MLTKPAPPRSAWSSSGASATFDASTASAETSVAPCARAHATSPRSLAKRPSPSSTKACPSTWPPVINRRNGMPEPDALAHVEVRVEVDAADRAPDVRGVGGDARQRQVVSATDADGDVAGVVQGARGGLRARVRRGQRRLIVAGRRLDVAGVDHHRVERARRRRDPRSCRTRRARREMRAGPRRRPGARRSGARRYRRAGPSSAIAPAGARRRFAIGRMVAANRPGLIGGHSAGRVCGM